jgi:hypothetical protein
MDLRLPLALRYGLAGPATSHKEGAVHGPHWSGAVDEREISLGMSRGGAAIPVAISETRASTAPVDGWAILDVVANAIGHVTNVNVIDVSADWPSWEQVAHSMLKALAGKLFAIPEGTAGLVIRIRVDSKLQYPDGASARGGPPSGVAKALKTITLPITIALGEDPSGSSEKPVRFVGARILSESPISL